MTIVYDDISDKGRKFDVSLFAVELREHKARSNSVSYL